MMDVAGQQSAKRLRILARAAATALMGKKTHAIKIRKDALALFYGWDFRCGVFHCRDAE